MQTASNRTLTRIVQSRQNSRVKELRAGLARGTRTEHGHLALEGEHLLEEAIAGGLQVKTIFMRSGSESLLERIRRRLASQIVTGGDVEVLELPEEIFASAVTTESPQGIAALVQAPSFTWADALADAAPDAAAPLMMVCAGVQDPGNLGTLVRSAEAFGASALIALPGTVSHWNAKALRSSAGSAFRLPILSATADEMFERFQERQIVTLAATVDDGLPATEVDLSGPVAILIGNEGSGLHRELIGRCDGRITIPFPGSVESLNAAIAGSILLYETSRQRANTMLPQNLTASGRQS